MSSVVRFPRTLASPVARGLIETRPEEMPGPFRGTTMTVDRYDVPLAVHAAWCSWCAENVSADEAAL